MSRSRFLEIFGPFIATAIMGAAGIAYTGGNLLDQKAFASLQQNFTNYALSISTSLLGFLLTIYTIIHSVNNERIASIRANGVYGRLMDFLRVALYAHAIVIALVLLFAMPTLGEMHWPIGKSGFNIRLWSILFVTAVTWSIATSIRFAYIFLHLIDDNN